MRFLCGIYAEMGAAEAASKTFIYSLNRALFLCSLQSLSAAASARTFLYIAARKGLASANCLIYLLLLGSQPNIASSPLLSA